VHTTAPVLFALVTLLVAFTGGCASWQLPGPMDDAPLRARAVSLTSGDIQVTAAVLSSEDSRRITGADVNGAGIQPVWIEVRNQTRQTLWLLSAGTDPDYFSPLEVAWTFHTALARAGNAAIDAHFESLAFDNPVPPGATRAGILFTNPHHRIRVLNVDLLGRRQFFPFTLFLPVPDEQMTEVTAQIVSRHADEDYPDLQDPEALRVELERLPCCATDAQGALPGDPLNLVFVGEFGDVAAAVVRRGFRVDRRPFDDVQRLFGRQPDFVGRVSGQGSLSPHWLRAWIAPLRYRGQPVFLVQAGRPMGGRADQPEDSVPVLHPDVDEVRNLQIQDLLYSGSVTSLGFVEGVGAVDIGRPRSSLAGGSYYTDGLRAVMLFATRPRAMSDVQLLDWVPALEIREAAAVAEHRNAGH
jgi:hypothetical protein